MKILVTGSAGFIGSNLVMRLLRTEPGIETVGLDSLNDYYDVSLKKYRLGLIDNCAAQHPQSSYTFIKGNIADRQTLENLFREYRFDVVVNLAAQPGARHSVTDPDIYIESNIIGFYNILETCRKYPVSHLVYASSSSVYGDNIKVPFEEQDMTDAPVSLYAATKKSDELLAHSYSRLYGIPTTGLRFFTVYGPAGRPDMAYYSFTERLARGKKIKLFNYGNCQRDFTYVDDIVEGICRVIRSAPQNQPPHKIYNIGNSHPEKMLDFVNILGEELTAAGILPEDFDVQSHIEPAEMQPGDVQDTFADCSALERDFGFKPHTGLREGIRAFAEWYSAYRNN